MIFRFYPVFVFLDTHGYPSISSSYILFFAGGMLDTLFPNAEILSVSFDRNHMCFNTLQVCFPVHFLL